ncbi:hypothetical protein KGZ13_34195, partial [Pseudomonas aeruginosa]|nr:hypothetical protein [Pseudomonas aeruginosa]
SSSSPISGIGIIAVILVSLLILGFGSIEGGLLDRQNGKLAIAVIRVACGAARAWPGSIPSRGRAPVKP